MNTIYMLLHRASFADAAHLIEDPTGPIQQLLLSNTHLKVSAAQWSLSPERSLYRCLETNIFIFRTEVEKEHRGTLPGMASVYPDTPLNRYEQSLLFAIVEAANDLAKTLDVVWEHPVFEFSGSS